jgi:hypothetical protein
LTLWSTFVLIRFQTNEGAVGEGSGKQRGKDRQVSEPDSSKGRRQPKADFLSSFAALQGVISRACAEEGEWQEKVAVGIRAALEFAAADPSAAHALTLAARRQRLPEGGREQEMITYFAGLLTAVAPPEKRYPVATEQGTVEAIALVARGHLLAGTTDELPSLAPEFVYLALMPYVGLAEAKRWTEQHSETQ